MTLTRSGLILGSIVFFVIVLVALPLPVSKRLKMEMVTMLSPLLKASSRITESIEDIRIRIKTLGTLREENVKLKARLKELEKETAERTEVHLENLRLKKLLKFKQQSPYEVVPARVIGRDITNWYHMILIDKGTDDGLRLAMPVVEGNGVVGTIIEAGSAVSKVLLIVANINKIGGITQETRVAGIVEGTTPGGCRLNYLPRNAGLKVGELVVSSGLGGIYPKSLIIGRVVSIGEEKYGLYKYADINPTVDFSRLEEVLVLKYTSPSRTISPQERE